MGDLRSFSCQSKRYSPLTQIDQWNVGRLELAWSVVIGQGNGAQAATPLFSNGVLYGITNWSITFAVDAEVERKYGAMTRKWSLAACAFAAASTTEGSLCMEEK
jgi:glucose dehydrogenase